MKNFTLDTSERVIQMFYAYAAYMLFMNVLAFLLIFVDKKRAQKRRRRIREKLLFGCAVMGGCFGEYIAMRWFHHKRRKGLFTLGVPAMTVVHIFLAIMLLELNVISLPFHI